jgi:hypothetical protein
MDFGLAAVLAAGVVSVGVAYRLPLAGLALVLLLVTTVFGYQHVPGAEVGGVSLRLPEFILAAALAGAVRQSRRPWPRPLRLYSVLALAFLTVAFVALVNGLLAETTSHDVALGQYRVFIYMGAAVLVALLIRDGKLVQVLDVALAVAALASIASLLAEIHPVGDRLNDLAGNSEALLRGGRVGPEGSLARVRLPGLALVYVVFLPGLALAVAGPRAWRRARVAALVLMLAALLVSLNRHMWVGLAIAILLATLLTRSSFRQPLLRMGVAFLLVCGVGVALLATLGGVRGIPERALTVVEPGKVEDSDSAKDRVRESKAAVTSIGHHPLLGIGPAGDYGAAAHYFPRESTKPRRYVHNQYLALAVFYGIPALLLFLALPLAVGAAGLRAVRRTQDELLHVVLAAALGTLGAVLLSSLVHIEFLLPETSLSFFFLLGVVLGAGILGAVEPVPGRAQSSEAAMAEVSA